MPRGIVLGPLACVRLKDLLRVGLDERGGNAEEGTSNIGGGNLFDELVFSCVPTPGSGRGLRVAAPSMDESRVIEGSVREIGRWKYRN